MFRLIKQVFISLLSFSGSLVCTTNASNFTTCMSLNNQLCMARSNLIYINPDEYNQGLWFIESIYG